MITRDTISGLSTGRIQYFGEGFGGGINIRTGSGGDALTILSSRPEALTTLWLGAGNDAVTIRDDGSGADGMLILIGQVGDDTVHTVAPDTWTAGMIVFGDDGNVLLGNRTIPIYNNDRIPERTPVNLIGVTTTASGSGNDVIDTGAGNDVIIGGFGSDTMNGASGNDIVIGDGGTVRMTGGVPISAETALFAGGNDTLIGGPGYDILAGGAGKDLFVGDMREDLLIGDYGRVTLDTQGRAKYAVRLAQGSLDLISAVQFGLYTPTPLITRTAPKNIIRPTMPQRAERVGITIPGMATRRNVSHHGGERHTRYTPQPAPEPHSPKEFDDAFLKAREAGLGKEDIFEWKRKQFRAVLKEEVDKAQEPEPGSFAEAFEKARREGKRAGDFFIYKGKKYDAGIVGEEEKKKDVPPDQTDRRMPGDLGSAAAGFMGWCLASPAGKKSKKRIDREAFAALDKRMNARRFREWR